jgi:homopolymeric O-antigen transport system ATP-binding protein
MTRPIIEVKNISKRYRLGQFNAHTIREEVEQFLQRIHKNGKSASIPQTSPNGTEFWALKDVSFSVQPGEVVGIIGRNGAGKSTLLKILSRITEPTSGEIRLRGRMASLLEVGTGFHPELTGRENIYLNGTILGMTKAEVKAKFDEIVAFAEIDKFLDTPVKRYSSGMYVRLAFAVAAHLDPEILIVDEVLAVGDALFQKKCLGKMGEISQHGRTVLFVSHNMPMIQSLCQRAVLLSSGTLTNIGEVNSVVQAYLADGVTEERGVVDAKCLPRSAGYEKVIRRIWIEDQSGEVINSVNMGGEMVLCFEFKTSKPIRDVGVGFGIETPQQMRLVSFNNYSTVVICRAKNPMLCSDQAE